MKLLRPTKTGFTLIELLVVISIIAILAGIALPAFTAAMLTAKIVDATSDAKQIALALRIQAEDYEGNFPEDRNSHDEPILTSNDAFRGLIPNYLQAEEVFAVGSSPVGKKADNNIKSKNTMLTRGENHWAYISGLSTTSNSSWPLIVDHTDGSGRYGAVDTKPGGTWKGTRAIVVRVDASASAHVLAGTGDKRFLRRYDEPGKNALELEDYMGKGPKLLEPSR